MLPHTVVLQQVSQDLSHSVAFTAALSARKASLASARRSCTLLKAGRDPHHKVIHIGRCGLQRCRCV